jgi:hypothetical protein
MTVDDLSLPPVFPEDAAPLVTGRSDPAEKGIER